MLLLVVCTVEGVVFGGGVVGAVVGAVVVVVVVAVVMYAYRRRQSGWMQCRLIHRLSCWL